MRTIASLILIVLLTSCITNQYAGRQKQCRDAQEFAQYLHSVPSHKDPLRTYLLWDMRPQGRWPFNFLSKPIKIFTMKIKLTEGLDPELKILGLKEGDEIEVTKDSVSKVGGCHFTIYRNGWPFNCSIWPDNYEIINQ